VVTTSYFTVAAVGPALDLSDLQYWWNLGIGSYSYLFLYHASHLSTLGSVVVANMPQLIVTMSSYCYNSADKHDGGGRIQFLWNPFEIHFGLLGQ
jgi:hypothetical protein